MQCRKCRSGNSACSTMQKFRCQNCRGRIHYMRKNAVQETAVQKHIQCTVGNIVRETAVQKYIQCTVGNIVQETAVQRIQCRKYSSFNVMPFFCRITLCPTGFRLYINIFVPSSLISKMLLRRAKNGASGKAATKIVTNPYWRTWKFRITFNFQSNRKLSIYVHSAIKEFFTHFQIFIK